MNLEEVAATIAYAFLVSGVLARKRHGIHPYLMGSGIGIDTCLVLLLQVQRGVIQSAVTEPYTALQYGHIIASTIAFALYFPVVTLAVRQLMKKGSSTERTWHIRLGVTAFSFRSVGFILMWTV